MQKARHNVRSQTEGNVLSGDQASLFVAFLGRGASRCSLVLTDNEQGLACLWQVALKTHFFP